MDLDLVGKHLFGKPSRLTLAVWIYALEKPRFFQSEPPRDVIRQSEAGRELEHLVVLGMLEKERPEDSRRIYYVRTASPLWQIIAAVPAAVDVA